MNVDTTPTTKIFPKILQHDYHDYSSIPDEAVMAEEEDVAGISTGDCGKRTRATSLPHHQPIFPVQLHRMLDDLEADGCDITGWKEHGRCFRIYDHDRFVKNILPKFFRQTKYASFQRQLNLYGFRRLTIGRDRGAYYHEMFLRGRPRLALKMKRMKYKGTGPRKPASPHTEPDFYQMPPVNTGDSVGQAGRDQELLIESEGYVENNAIGLLNPSDEANYNQVPEEEIPLEWDEPQVPLSQFDDCASEVSGLTYEDAAPASPSPDSTRSSTSFNTTSSLLDDLVLAKPSYSYVAPPTTFQNEDPTGIESEKASFYGAFYHRRNINLADFLTSYYQKYGVPEIMLHEVTSSSGPSEESNASAPTPTSSGSKSVGDFGEDTRHDSLGLDDLNISADAAECDAGYSPENMQYFFCSTV